ncbi:MAG: histidine phosphatase family protein [Desulfamplus sp.]|nr:histidine phosphatase family protein [Desulfamplus sp.]
MKNLILVRHAKAAPLQGEYDSDFPRPLIKKGIKDAKKMAEKIKCNLLGNPLFISSPANRAFETAHIFAGKLNYPTVKILIREVIYNDPKAEELLSLIKEVDDNYDTVLIFGHNPSLSDFASSLIKDFEFNIPKSGVVAFSFDKSSWRDIEAQGGILNYVEYPSKKSEELSGFEESLILKISESISSALKNINPNAAGNVIKSVAKYSTRLAENFTGNLKQPKSDKSDKSDKKSEKIGETVEHECGNKEDGQPADK